MLSRKHKTKLPCIKVLLIGQYYNSFRFSESSFQHKHFRNAKNIEFNKYLLTIGRLGPFKKLASELETFISIHFCKNKLTEI